jgi:kynurenine 3-monooxygenase
MSSAPVTIVGAGPSGALLAIFMARRGIPVRIYERRADPRRGGSSAGRSINLALAERGLHALRRAGVEERIQPLLIPMRGRLVHELGGATTLLPYGQKSSEVIYSVSRPALNRLLTDAAIQDYGVEVHFEQICTGVDLASGELEMRAAAAGTAETVTAPQIIGADGAGSAVRAAMVAAQSADVREDLLPHQYKELTVPPTPSGAHRLAKEGLHIWPRGSFMLIALPNVDASFTATLFLPRTGAESFASLSNGRALHAFFARHFPEAQSLIPTLERDFFANPTGSMATVHCRPWHIGGSALLIGDAAHAIVPFHGQGMNCALEDCVVFDELLERGGEWAHVFGEFERLRRPHVAAIAEMALENYVEMRDTVRDRKFQLQKLLSLELERRFPERFIPRYSMVMFHHEIGYADAYRRGRIQQDLLDELTRAARYMEDIDWRHAGKLIAMRLPPVA